MIQKAYKYRVFPTEEQETLFNKTFGACRYVYNLALETKITAYKYGKNVSSYDLSKQLTDLKKDENVQWLSEVSAASLGWSLRNLDTAYKNFFKRVKKGMGKAGFPKFKSKYKGHDSFQFHQGYDIDFEKGTIDIPKCRGLKVIYHRTFTGVPKTCTISRTPSKKYFISILVQQEGEPLEKKEITKEDSITIHLGIRNFAYLSTGEIIEHPKYFMKSLNRLKILDKRLSKKREMNKNTKRDGILFKGSNIEKARIARAILHEKIANQRIDFLHNLSARLVRQHNTNTICIENWEISEMIKDKYLSKYIADSAWRTFWNQIDYKSEWNGKNVVKTEKKFPSSKKCNTCNTINQDLKLSQIIWTCKICGTTHDREQNAINNISELVS